MINSEALRQTFRDRRMKIVTSLTEIIDGINRKAFWKLSLNKIELLLYK